MSLFSEYILKDYPNIKIGYYYPIKNKSDEGNFAYKCAVSTTNWDTLFKLQEKYGEKIPKEETKGLFKVEAARIIRNFVKEQQKGNDGKKIYDEIITDCAFQYIGSEKEEEKSKAYLHRGIATRSFERKFSLADHVEVVSADLADGLLTLKLVREIPEASKPRTIAINSNGKLIGVKDNAKKVA